MSKLDWSKKEITQDEALALLQEADERLDYVDKLLSNQNRPRPARIFTSYLANLVLMVRELRYWVAEGGKG